MRVAYVIDNKCIDFYICDSLELATSLIPSLYPPSDDLENITAIDADDENCQGIGSVKIDGVWYEAHHPKVLGWDGVREARFPLLRFSDWTQLGDSPLELTKKQEWATYRQALRDVTSSYTNPEDSVFPADPDGKNAQTFS
jgi:hypothetical protein